MPYPVSVSVEPALANRNRLTTFFRLILAIPHFTGAHIIGIRQFTLFYMRWRVRATSYLMLLEDAYPPFGDASYPASIEVTDPVAPRDRLIVAWFAVAGG
jgi:hypothetical protein